MGRVGKVLQSLREERGLSQEAFGLAIGESQQTVSLLEKGRRRATLDDLRRIERVLKIPHGYVVRAAGYVDDPKTVREAIEADPQLAGDKGAWRATVLAAYDRAVELSAKSRSTPPATPSRARK